MRAGRAPARGLLVAILLLVHLFLQPVLVGWLGAPDLLAGGLLLAALSLRAGHAAALGFGLGIVEAALSLAPIGPTALVYTVGGYVAARSRDLLFSDEPAFEPLFLFGGVWVLQVALGLVRGELDAGLGLVAAPLSALTTALVCWAADRLLGRLLAT